MTPFTLGFWRIGAGRRMGSAAHRGLDRLTRWCARPAFIDPVGRSHPPAVATHIHPITAGRPDVSPEHRVVDRLRAAEAVVFESRYGDTDPSVARRRLDCWWWIVGGSGLSDKLTYVGRRSSLTMATDSRRSSGDRRALWFDRLRYHAECVLARPSDKIPPFMLLQTNLETLGSAHCVPLELRGRIRRQERDAVRLYLIDH
jgi:hypothetical protein